VPPQLRPMSRTRRQCAVRGDNAQCVAIVRGERDELGSVGIGCPVHNSPRRGGEAHAGPKGVTILLPAAGRCGGVGFLVRGNEFRPFRRLSAGVNGCRGQHAWR
jgi:hypothetical protein